MYKARAGSVILVNNMKCYLTLFFLLILPTNVWASGQGLFDLLAVELLWLIVIVFFSIALPFLKGWKIIIVIVFYILTVITFWFIASFVSQAFNSKFNIWFWYLFHTTLPTILWLALIIRIKRRGSDAATS